jgi:hypothetical protein
MTEESVNVESIETNPFENEKRSESSEKSSTTLETENIGSESDESNIYVMSLRTEPRSNTFESDISYYLSDNTPLSHNSKEDTVHFVSEETKRKLSESEVKESEIYFTEVTKGFISRCCLSSATFMYTFTASFLSQIESIASQSETSYRLSDCNSLIYTNNLVSESDLVKQILLWNDLWKGYVASICALFGAGVFIYFISVSLELQLYSTDDEKQIFFDE